MSMEIGMFERASHAWNNRDYEGLSETDLSLENRALYLEDQELDLFLGSLVSNVGKAVGGIGKTVEGAVKSASRVAQSVGRVVPLSVIGNLAAMSPAGMAVRAGVGALDAASKGGNVFQGALRGLAPDPVTKFYIDTGFGVARGQNLLQSAKRAGEAGIKDAREALRYAAMVAPFVPGIGTGVAAALGAANALAAGQPITEAVIAAARGAVPGGAIAQSAFDVGANLLRGKNIADSLISAARQRLPGGPAAGAAFDAGVALVKGKSIQDAAFAAAGRIVPPSPYAADALSFVRRVTSGENVQKAALSSLGQVVMRRIERQTRAILPSLENSHRGRDLLSASRHAAQKAPDTKNLPKAISGTQHFTRGPDPGRNLSSFLAKRISVQGPPRQLTKPK